MWCGACGSGTGSPRRDDLVGRLLPLFRGLLLRALCFLRHLNPPLHVVVWMRESLAASSGALCRLARRPGCRRSRFAGHSRLWCRSGAQQLVAGFGINRNAWRVPKKKGCSTEHPLKPFEELPLLRGLLLCALGSLLRRCARLRVSDSASDEPLGRHNGWAEPSTLIPDVDYG